MQPPKPKRQSLWDRKRSAWYKDAARTEIAEHSALLLWVFGMSAVVLIGNGLSFLGQPWAWFSLVTGVLCAGTVWGLYSCKNWARWVGGGAAAVLALVLFASLLGAVTGGHTVGVRMGAILAVMMGIWGSSAYHLLGPGSRKLFQRARSGLDE